MIVLDTNVLSELMRRPPHQAVFQWAMRQRRRDLLTTSVSRAEILYGIALLPTGRRKAGLTADAERMFAEDFEGRVLAFEDAAATHYAEIAADRRRRGRPIEVLDCQIAAIARAKGAAVATRDVGDFEGCGVQTINPWNAT